MVIIPARVGIVAGRLVNFLLIEKGPSLFSSSVGTEYVPLTTNEEPFFVMLRLIGLFNLSKWAASMSTTKGWSRYVITSLTFPSVV